MVFEILYLFPMSKFVVNLGKMKTIILLVLSRYFHLKMTSQTERNPTKKIMDLHCLEKLLFDLFEIFQADIKFVQRKLNFNGNSKLLVLLSAPFN